MFVRYGAPPASGMARLCPVALVRVEQVLEPHVQPVPASRVEEIAARQIDHRIVAARHAAKARDVVEEVAHPEGRDGSAKNEGLSFGPRQTPV